MISCGSQQNCGARRGQLRDTVEIAVSEDHLIVAQRVTQNVNDIASFRFYGK